MMAYFPRSKRAGLAPVKRPHEGRRVTSAFYVSREWRKCRASYITDHPLCEQCLLANRTRKANVVDHIQPINPTDAYDTQNGRYGEPLDFDNLQSLCTPHHAKKSGRERHERS